MSRGASGQIAATRAASNGRGSVDAPGQRNRFVAFLTADRTARWTSRLLLLVLWQFASTITDHVAGPVQAVQLLVHEFQTPYRGEPWAVLDNELVRNLAISLERTGTALFFIMLIGVPIGYAMGRWWRAQAFFTDMVTVGLALPAFIWALLSVMWFGFGNRAPIFTAIVSATPGLTVYVMQATFAIPRDLRDMSDAYGVPFRRQVPTLVLPSMAGALIAGLRLAIIAAWGCVILVEWFGSDSGAGFRARYFYDNADYTGLAGWTLIVLVIVITVDRGIIERIHRRAYKWRSSIASFGSERQKESRA